jgi:hypothetical protein
MTAGSLMSAGMPAGSRRLASAIHHAASASAANVTSAEATIAACAATARGT